MKEPFISMKKKLGIFSSANRPYKDLRKHLNRQPVGYPATLSGIEIRLLKEIFTPAEAQAALLLSYRPQPFEVISSRAVSTGLDGESLRQLLVSMEKKGGIFVRHSESGPTYALHPFVIGMYEMQLNRLTPGFYLDAHKYGLLAYGMEYLTTSVPQMRVIPIQEALSPVQNVAPYDHIREIVDRANVPIAVVNCICKTGKDLISDPCRLTDRREICMVFRDFARTCERFDEGRIISKKEAFDILDLNEKEGLVLLTASMQEPQVVCSCCDCCCGILEAMKFMPRIVDYAASNFSAELKAETCTGCALCVKRCQMQAIQCDETTGKPSAVDSNRCIGCGLCVSTCKNGSITLKKKETEFIPPKDIDDLYEVIMQNKKGLGGKLLKLAKGMIGLKS